MFVFSTVNKATNTAYHLTTTYQVIRASTVALVDTLWTLTYVHRHSFRAFLDLFNFHLTSQTEPMMFSKATWMEVFRLRWRVAVKDLKLFSLRNHMDSVHDGLLYIQNIMSWWNRSCSEFDPYASQSVNVTTCDPTKMWYLWMHLPVSSCYHSVFCWKLLLEIICWCMHHWFKDFG